jgi:hypothetical protein
MAFPIYPKHSKAFQGCTRFISASDKSHVVVCIETQFVMPFHFLGLFNLYTRFLKKTARITLPSFFFKFPFLLSFRHCSPTLSLAAKQTRPFQKEKSGAI